MRGCCLRAGQSAEAGASSDSDGHGAFDPPTLESAPRGRPARAVPLRGAAAGRFARGGGRMRRAKSRPGEAEPRTVSCGVMATSIDDPREFVILIA